MSQEPQPPIIRLKEPQGQIIYPRLVKESDGNWRISKPEKIRKLLKLENLLPYSI